MTPECKAIRHHVLIVSYKSGHGHIPTSFSIVEILYAIYKVVRHDPVRPDWPQRDIFILSKGHAALAHYCVLSHFGYFPAEAVESFGAFGTKFGCHADRIKVPGIEVSTGSLGHGIGVATGIALAFKIQRSTRRVFTLIGDGESNEGTVWEAVMVAVHQKLNNLTILYDHNRSQVRSLPIPNPAERFQAFGCDVHEVNGHDMVALCAALSAPAKNVKVIVANTVKGYGCRTFVENMFVWHRKSPDEAQLVKLLGELDADAV